MNADARTKGLRPLCIASYGEADSPRFAAIWQNNTGADAVLWNNDGTLDSLDQLNQRNAAQVSNWCRPVFITLNKNLKFCSVFEASDAGQFHVTSSTPAIGYALEYEQWATQKGFLPICVQAAGEDTLTATFAAIFVEKDKVSPRVWNATGIEGGTNIANRVRAAMTDAIIRQGSVAIVYQKRLVYARGFNMAEANWPQAEPRIRIRLASCSKTITALAIFQLIEEGKLKLSDRMQAILNLKTPAGHEPVDPQFSQITIQQLLEHSSGLNTDMFDSDLSALQKTFGHAGKTVSLPVSAGDTDSFIASLPMVSPPGQLFVYSNCGYYLLGRVVNQLRGTSRPIDAYQKHLFDPLQITRIRRAKDLVADQEPGEARYQDPDLRVGTSVFPGGQLVPSYYGTYHLEILRRRRRADRSGSRCRTPGCDYAQPGRQPGSEAKDPRLHVRERSRSLKPGPPLWLRIRRHQRSRQWQILRAQGWRPRRRALCHRYRWRLGIRLLVRRRGRAQRRFRRRLSECLCSRQEFSDGCPRLVSSIWNAIPVRGTS